MNEQCASFEAADNDECRMRVLPVGTVLPFTPVFFRRDFVGCWGERTRKCASAAWVSLIRRSGASECFNVFDLLFLR